MRRRSNGKSVFKVAGLSCVLAVAMGSFGYITWQSIGKEVSDKLGCFSAPHQKHSVVLIDVSEPRFNEEQSRSLKRYLDQLYEALEFNEKLSVITTAEDQIGSVPSPLFHVCGQATDASQLAAVNAEEASAGFLAKQKQRLFENVYAPSVNQLLSANPASKQRFQSPVLEMVQSIRQFHPLRSGDRLIVISDLIQNSDSVQFCRTQNDMPPFSLFSGRSVYERLKPQSLDGIEVEVLMIQRQGYGRNDFSYCYGEEELRLFWRDYFVANGVAQPNFIRIRHGIVGE